MNQNLKNLIDPVPTQDRSAKTLMLSYLGDKNVVVLSDKTHNDIIFVCKTNHITLTV